MWPTPTYLLFSTYINYTHWFHTSDTGYNKYTGNICTVISNKTCQHPLQTHLELNFEVMSGKCHHNSICKYDLVSNLWLNWLKIVEKLLLFLVDEQKNSVYEFLKGWNYLHKCDDTYSLTFTFSIILTCSLLQIFDNAGSLWWSTKNKKVLNVWSVKSVHHEA